MLLRGLSRHELVSPWTGSDSQGEECERKQKVERESGRSLWSEQARGHPSFKFCRGVYTLCPFGGGCLVSYVPLCVG